MSPVQTQDSGWEVARSQDDAEVLLVRTRGFHDVFFRVAYIDSGAYVDKKSYSCEADYPSLWMLVQTQWADTPAVELLLERLERVEFMFNKDRCGRVRLGAGGWEVVLGGWQMIAARLLFRFGTSEDLGPSPPTFWSRVSDSFGLVGE